jgi:hypothetical protein
MPNESFENLAVVRGQKIPQPIKIEQLASLDDPPIETARCRAVTTRLGFRFLRAGSHATISRVNAG